jgi:hypothetical protein
MSKFRLRKEFMIGSEIALIIVGIFFTLFIIFDNSPLEQPQYVSNFVTGCTTLSGILAAFTGFWLAHIYSNASEQTKKWLSKRIAVVVPLIGMSLISVLGGSNELLYGTVEAAVRDMNLGISLILMVDFEVCFMTLYRGFGDKELGYQGL